MDHRATYVGDRVSVTGCVDPTLHISTTTMGPPALAGTTRNGLSVDLLEFGNGERFDDSYTFNNLQGSPNYLIYSHNSDFINTTNASDPYAVANGGATPYALSRNLSFTNSIFVGGEKRRRSAREARRRLRERCTRPFRSLDF